MIDLFCNLDSEIELIRTINLDNKINHSIGDISSISYDIENDKTYLLSDNNPGYYIRIDDKLLEYSNSQPLNSEKIIFNQYKNSLNFDYDSESFYIDDKNMFVLSGISNSSNKSIIFKYNYINRELEHFSIINFPKENFYSITAFNNNNLILLTKNQLNKDNKNSDFTKYRIISKELKFLNSGLIKTEGLVMDFQKIKNTNFFISIIDEGKQKNIGIYKLDDFLSNNNYAVEKRLNISLPKSISKFNNIQGISFGPKLATNEATILLVNDNNKKRFSKNSKFFNLNLNSIKYPIIRFLGKLRNSQIFIFKFKRSNC